MFPGGGRGKGVSFSWSDSFEPLVIHALVGKNLEMFQIMFARGGGGGKGGLSSHALAPLVH
jgi:hypothetical protein